MSELAQRQLDLVRALVAGGPTPEGFDASALGVAAAALLHKRAGAARHHIPVAAASLGDRFDPLFTQWATHRPKSDSAAEAHEFIEHLYSIGELDRPTTARRFRPAARWFSVRRYRR